MKTRFIFILISVCFIFIRYVESLELTEYSVVKGYTYSMIESESGISYKPLPGIKINAYREYPIFEEPVISGPTGAFKLQVPAGNPFWVLFYEGDKVPELQQIAGKGETVNDINITLLTVKQYKKMKVVEQINTINTFKANMWTPSTNDRHLAEMPINKPDSSPPLQDLNVSSTNQYDIVRGYTYSMVKSRSGIRYESLPGIKINAYRGREYPIFEEPVISGLMGTFELRIPKGEPFWVFLYGEGRVPELQQITAKGDTESTFHITLLTVEQYKEMKVVDQINAINTFKANMLMSSIDDRRPIEIQKSKWDSSPPLKDLKEVDAEKKPNTSPRYGPPYNLRVAPCCGD